jgi:ATP-dependent helicase/nuclease subunit A
LVTNDTEQRHRAVCEADRSFIVEASAGTGKTNTLTRRILNLVLEKGPFGPPLRLHQICAITFTEKAAGEMKIRLRQSFEQIALSAQDAGSAVFAARAREALTDVEIASISTFHAFAVSLLKERPLEAGLDPHFAALDEIHSELFFRETWDTWISRAISERMPVLERALRGGLSLSALQDLARIMRQNVSAVRTLSCDAPPDEEQIHAQIRSLLQQGQDFLKQGHNPKDRLVDYLEKAIDWLKTPGSDRPKPSRPGNAGAAGNWDCGKEGLADIRNYIREVVDFCGSFERLPAQRLLNEVIQWISTEFMREWESRKRAGGLLDFDDQLWLARDLLLRNKSVRSEFQTRYATLLVDEFQDTDPVQWDLVRLLTATNLNETDRSKLQPGPGRLFIVGDPKQSIYRFRNADIETYLEIADPMAMLALGLERLQLTTNFRSVPSILRFVDAAFTGAMSMPADGRYQPDYLPFGGQGFREEEPNPPSVHLLGDRKAGENSGGTVREFIEGEAARIADLIRQIPGSATWKILDTEGENWRTPRFGDIAILLPVLSHADALEDALRDREIPYVLEGGKFYYTRSEVSSAITALRAIGNPNDSVALYGALRSIFFGFSDEDLLRARVAGQELDYRAPVLPESPLAYPFEILRDLHRHRHERRASETLEIFLQKTGAREVLAVRGLQSIANLGKLARTLRALQGETTFSQVVELLATMDEEGLAESESRLMEERSDAVRILSIHKSKGLDFPIVFVAGLGLQRRNQTKKLLADPHGKKVFGLSLGSRESGLQTPGWEALVEEERKREKAELVRLLYVALTRACDHLVLSTHTQNWKMSNGADQWIPDMERTRLKPLSSFIEDCVSKDTDLVRWVDLDSLEPYKKSKPADLSGTRDWRSRLEQEYLTLQEMLRRTPSSAGLQAAGQIAEAAEPEDRALEERSTDIPGNRAIRLGIAFHEAMEQIDLSLPGDNGSCIQKLIAWHSLDPKSARSLEEMINTTLSSSLMERARQAVKSGGKILREVPFVRPLEGTAVEEGKIDLLFQEGDGWVLVDYKTDWVSAQGQRAEDYFRHKYSAQVREYVKALLTLPIKVVSAYIFLARTGMPIQIT